MEKISLDQLKGRNVILFNQVAEEIRCSYNKLIADLGKGDEKNIDWWASEVASRSPYTTPLFDDCCDFVFLQKIISQKTEMEIIVNKDSLKKAIVQYGKKNNIEIKISSNNTIRSKLKFILWPFLRYIKLLCIYGTNLVSAKISAPKKDMVISKDCILVNTFVHDDSFEQSDGRYRDRYYNHFGNFLTQKEQTSLYYVPTLLNTSSTTGETLRAIRACPQQFILKEDFLRVFDYLYVFFSPFRVIQFLFKKGSLNGVDITPLIRHSFWHSIVSSGTTESLLKYQFIQRLKEKNISIRLVIEWFENQNIQKTSVLGFHHYYPHVRVIGYQGYLVSKNYICMFPIPEEYENNLVPDTIVVSGKALLNAPKEFCDLINVRVAPAFRFMDLQYEKNNERDKDSFTVLVTLPACTVDSEVILQRLIGVSDLKINNMRVVVKAHPTSSSAIMNMIKKRGVEISNFQLVTKGSFIELADQANVVISNQSSTCMEALTRGVPVIIISQQALSQNPIPLTISTTMWRECYSSEEVKLALQYFYETGKNSQLDYDQIANGIKVNYFEPVTREGVRSFFKFSEFQNEM